MLKRFLIVAFMIALATGAFAGGKGKGKGKGNQDESLGNADRRGWSNGRPPGWSQGEKKGWRGGSLPPGLAKKDRNHPAVRKFLGDLDTHVVVLQKAAEAKKLPKSRVEALLESFQIATRKGVDGSTVRAALATLLDFDGTEEEVEWTAKGLTYSLDRGVELPDVGSFLKNKLTNKVRGVELMSSLYDEIDRHAEKK